MNAVKALLAAPAAALLMAWAPASPADSSFSFSFHGVEHFNRSHFHGGYHKHHYGRWPIYRHHGYRYGPRVIHRHPRHGVYWIPARPYRGYGYGPRHAPACIYVNGYRYCR
ncbi:MAG: hypothetical protein U5R46_20125 [Gammaproteobacteria bacterium]|nr:hypothetical protein [Gammaproteobacteria bacterium]